MEYDHEHRCLTNGPDAQAEADLIELGYRAAQELAYQPTARDREGNTWRDGDTSFYRVTCWRDLATNVTDSLGKGDRVLVVGQLRMRSWETPEGEQRSVVEVTAEEVGPSLRWATAKPERATRKPNGGASDPGQFKDEPAF